MNFRKALLTATMLGLPAVASAQSPQSYIPGWGTAQPRGIYIAAGAGLNWMNDVDATAQGALAAALGRVPVGQSGTIDFDVGWVGLVSVGYAFGNGIRVELEGSYRDNDVSGISGFNGISAPRNQTGSVNTWAVMANVFYDFNLGWNMGSVGIVPYIGGGIGYAQQNFDNVTVSTTATGRTLRMDGDYGNFAWQLIAGAAFPIHTVPGLAFTAEGRYFATPSDDVDATFTSATGVSASQKGAVEVESSNWSLLVGLRYTFGVTPPPPPPVAPAAAPAPARTYLVFFDWDRANLTDRARQIISEAAQNSRVAQVTRIEVSGHADRSGTPQYNQRLSQRRADAVAAELERQGVPRTAMTIQAFGESRPLVPTADGVREPQNRRVEIVLR